MSIKLQNKFRKLLEKYGISSEPQDALQFAVAVINSYRDYMKTEGQRQREIQKVEDVSELLNAETFETLEELEEFLK